jgi:hypothetical protein
MSDAARRLVSFPKDYDVLLLFRIKGFMAAAA